MPDQGPTSSIAASSPPERKKVSPILPLVIAFGNFMAQLDSTIIATSIPQMAKSLNESPLHLNVAITAYLISLAVFIPISGWVADRFGTRNVFCCAIALFTCGSMLCGASTSLSMLVVMRIIQGLGGAMMTPVGRLILVRAFPKAELVQAMSYISIPALVGPTIGPLVGGFLTTYISWRWIFYINVPIGAIGILCCLRLVPNFRVGTPPPFDFKGFLVVGFGLGLLQVAFEGLRGRLVSPTMNMVLFAVAASLLTFYFYYAKRRTAPAIDLTMLRIRSFRTSVMAGGLTRIAIASVPFMLPLLFQVGFGMTPLQSGSLTFVTSIGAMLMKTIAPKVLRFFGFRKLLTYNGIVLGCMIAGMSLFQAGTSRWVMLGYLVTYGFIRSVQFTSVNALSYADLTSANMSKATSLASVVQQLCNSFGVATAATLLALQVGKSITITPTDFRHVLLGIAILPMIATVGFLSLRPTDGMQVSGHGAGGAGKPLAAG